MSDSLPPHGLQHTRLPCPSPTPRACSNSCPSSQWCQMSPSPPAFNLPKRQGLYKESAHCIRWPKVWSFSFNISPSNEYSGLTSFRIDWFGLLAVPGTLKSLLQHHSTKASILQHSAFFMVQLSHPYMTTGKTIALTRWTFVGKRTLSSNLILWGIFWKFPSPKIFFFPCVFDIYLNTWCINLYLGYFFHSLISPQCFSFLLKFIFFFLFVGELLKKF